MLSDLNLSSMSEDCVNWSTLLPERAVSTKQQPLAIGPENVTDNTVPRTLSLQDAFQKSKKSFIERSKVRQETVNQAATEHYEKHSRMKKKTTRQTKSKQHQQQSDRGSSAGGESVTRDPSSTTSDSSSRGKLDKGLFVYYSRFSIQPTSKETEINTKK